MPLDKERNNEYKPQYLYLEDQPLTPDEIKKLKTKEQEEDDDRGVVVIEIL